ncbi:MAG TPA: hypothetical protein VGW12_10800 [Pyrinomonadaceae bacterium]|nr:hypothetical protein [Pyrinomonadaceae bacterium]
MQNIVPIPDGNAAKYFSYREAWGRIRKAIGCGFYLEAVTLEESIISDRLFSYLITSGVMKPESKDSKSFGKLIEIWRKQVPEAITDKRYSNLQVEVFLWKNRRNHLVHGIVKSAPGTAPQDVLDFRKEAECAARDGEDIAKSVCNWYRRTKKKLTGENVDCGT